MRGAPLQLSAAGPGGVLELSDAALQVRGGEQPQWRLGLHFIRQIVRPTHEDDPREVWGDNKRSDLPLNQRTLGHRSNTLHGAAAVLTVTLRRGVAVSLLLEAAALGISEAPPEIAPAQGEGGVALAEGEASLGAASGAGVWRSA